jgi:hypothetical protein
MLPPSQKYLLKYNITKKAWKRKYSRRRPFVILLALEILENYFPVGHTNHWDSKAHTTPKRAISNQAISTRKKSLSNEQNMLRTNFCGIN